jgi:DHA2 family multidrug resistance protein
MSSGPLAPEGQAGGDLWRPRVSPWLISASVMLATFMEVLDTTIVAVSLPHMAGNLSATTEEATWVLTSYLVANAIVLPASGWLSLYSGRKRFLLACVTIFTTSSLLCGLAPSLPVLVFARVLQGLGVVVAPIVGPTLGGWLTDSYTWRWIFYINIPIGILALFMMSRNVEDPPYIRNARPGRIDGIGFAFMILWLGTLQIILDKGRQEDWFGAVWIRWFTGLSAAAMVLFVFTELRTRDPIVNLRILKNRNFGLGTSLMTLFGAALYSTVTLLPMFLQTLMGYPAVKSGIAITPRGLGSLFTLPLVGRLIGVVDARWMLVCGLSLFGASSFLFGRINLDIGMRNVVLPNLFQGLGMGLIFVPLATLTMGSLRNEQVGNATSIFNLMRNLGGSFGISIATTFLARNAQSHQALMVSHLTPYDPAYQQRLAAIQNGLAPLTGAPQAGQQAYAALNGILVQQAALRSFVDTFLWIALLIAFCVPWAFFMKKAVSRRAPA